MSAGDGIEYLLWRHRLPDGEVTTVYAVRHPLRDTHVRVLFFPRTEHLDVWCRQNGVDEAVVGGFFLRDPYRPLGELWIDGREVRHEPVAEPYGRRRASVVVEDGRVRLVERAAAPERPTGDLLQAGPLLLSGGEIVFDGAEDREGFSTGAGQFDSDITDGRYPRAALGISDESLVAVACDGRRSNVDGGLSMTELADVMVELGARDAINLDGGGSTTLVHRGHLLNRPYSSQDQPAPASRRVVSALAFGRRVVVAASLALALAMAAGCGSDDGEVVETGAASFTGVPWVVSGGLDVEGWEAVAPSATFDDETVGGSTGCNNYMTGYTTDGGSIEIEEPAGTRKLCPEPEGVMEQEAAYLAALPTADHFRVDGESLALFAADGTDVASFVRAG